MRLQFFIFILLSMISGVANSYVGPGLGLGAIGALIGILLAVVLAFVGLFWYPIKRFIKRNDVEDESVEEQEK